MSMPSSEKAVIIQRAQSRRIAVLQLNRPEKRNILSLEMIQAVTAALKSLEQDSDLQLLILEGRGEHFSAGGDLRYLALARESSDVENLNQVKQLSKMFYTLRRFPLPVICKPHGAVFGGGLGFMALSDIVIAREDSRFCFSEVKLALAPALVMPFLLEKISASYVRELMLSARVFTAQEALRIGLVHFSGSEKECESHAQTLISRLLSFDKTALKQTKKLFSALASLNEEEARDYTAQALAERRKSPEVSKQIERFFKSRQVKKRENAGDNRPSLDKKP